MTTMKKDIRNGWRAEDSFPLGEGMDGKTLCPRTLDITTSKNYNGKLVTSAMCSLRNNGFTCHAFGFGGGGDFRETIIADAVSCTEKTVAAQHALAMQQIDAIKARAVAFYAAKQPQQQAA